MSERQQRRKLARRGNLVRTSAAGGHESPPQPGVTSNAIAPASKKSTVSVRENIARYGRFSASYLFRLAIQIRQSKLVTAMKQHPDPRVQRWHYLTIAAIPAILTCLNRNWLFENLDHMDPWYYFGLFQHFPRFHVLLPNYMGERVGWIFPGYIFTHLFGQIPGVIVLHIVFFLACLYSFHYIVASLINGPTALISTMLLGCNSFFIGANGWDYPEAPGLAYLLLSVALLLPTATRRRWIYLTLSGVAWFALVYTYLAWIIFTPAYAWLAVRLIQERDTFWRTCIRVVCCTMLGGTITTLGFWAVYHVMGAQGFFFKANLGMAFYIYKLETNPWLNAIRWQQCTWVVLPALGFCMAAAWAAAGLSPRFRQKRSENSVLWFYIYSFGLMVIWTVRPTRLLAYDYRTSILMPALFVVFGFLVFRVPQTATVLQFYLVTGLGPLISVAPLGSRFLYLHAPRMEIVLAGCIVLLALSCWGLLRRAGPLVWGTTVLLFACTSFSLVPGFTGTAWRLDYSGYDLYERVNRAVRIISDRLPRDTYPVFWFDNSASPIASESRAIMCAFATHILSAWKYPEIDKTFPTGSRVFLLTEQRDVVAHASDTFARKGMPTNLVSQDHVVRGDTSYWITQLVVLPAQAASVQ